MTDEQARIYNMGQSVEQIFSDYALVYAANPSLISRVATLTGHIDAADVLEQEQGSPTQPITQNKRTIRANMVKTGVALAKGIATYANDNNLPQLAAEYLLYNKTYLNATRDTSAFSRNDVVYQKANTLRPDLLLQGFTDQMITDYGTLVSDFNGLIGAPRAKRSQKKVATTGVDAELKNMVALLNNEIDAAMGVYDLLAPDFYNAYHNARKIDNTGVRHVSLQLKIKEVVTGTVLPFALGTLLETATTARSGSTGRMQFFSLPTGVYTLKIELDGYQTQTINNVAINPTGLTRLEVALVKVPVV